MANIEVNYVIENGTEVERRDMEIHYCEILAITHHLKINCIMWSQRK